MAELLERVYWRLLVIRCQTGDHDAFAELVARCQPRLRAYLYKLLAGSKQIDDVAQEVWMDVHTGLGNLEEPAAFLPWFYRIAHNRAYRLLRKRGRPVASLDEVDVAAEESEPEFSPEDARAVYDALEKLVPEHREVVLLRYMENMSYQDIAAVTGCRLGTIRSRLHHAKRA